MKEKVGLCFCKQCDKMQPIMQRNIDDQDRQIVEMKCGHKRVYRLITSNDDYRK